MPDAGASQSDLMQQVRSYLKQVYEGMAGGGGAAPPNAKTILAFEPIGIPVSPADFRLNENDPTSPLMPMVGVQRTSLYSNWIRRVDATGTLDLGLNGTVDGQYGMILDEATAASNAVADGFNAAKASAKEAFDSADTSGLDTSGTGASVQYHPVRPTPPDWYDPSDEANWSAGSFGSGSPQAGGTAPTTGAPIVRSTLPIHVLPAAFSPALVQPARLTFAPMMVDRPVPVSAPSAGGAAAATSARTTPAVTTPIAARPAFRPMFLGAAALRDVAVTPSQPATAAQPTTAGSPSTPILPPNGPITRFGDLVNLSQQATTQPTQSDSLSVAFEYCLVRLDRPWLSFDFLMSGGWYMPGAHKGDLSSGNDLSGNGRFSLIPIAFVAIKNLKITANWSATDRQAVQNAVSIGAFSLVGRQFDGASLTCDGMQIIGWVCASMPALPPATDPSLVPAAPDNPLQDLVKAAEQTAEGALAQKLGKLLGN